MKLRKLIESSLFITRYLFILSIVLQFILWGAHFGILDAEEYVILWATQGLATPLRLSSTFKTIIWIVTLLLGTYVAVESKNQKMSLIVSNI